jgi:hypothetical protein
MTSASPGPLLSGSALHRRAVAVSNAKWFRALAWRALRDGAPKADLRAANARAAARIILRRAREDAARTRPMIDAVMLAA